MCSEHVLSALPDMVAPGGLRNGRVQVCECSSVSKEAVAGKLSVGDAKTFSNSVTEHSKTPSHFASDTWVMYL